MLAPATARRTVGLVLTPATARRTVGLVLAVALAGCVSHASSTRPATSTGTAPSAKARPAPGALPDRAAQDATVKRLAATGQPIYCAGGRRRLVALTFDDGPGPYTAILLRRLRDAGARATFFLVGRNVLRHPRAARREHELGAIGNHTMTHPDLTAIGATRARREIADGGATALRAAGGPVDLFRPPYGRRNASIDGHVRGAGMAQILWDVNSLDSRRSPSADFREIAANVRRHARPGSIVLLHENRGQTIRAMRSILSGLKRDGLRAVTVPQLLAADPPSPAQLGRGPDGCPAGRRR